MNRKYIHALARLLAIVMLMISAFGCKSQTTTTTTLGTQINTSKTTTTLKSTSSQTLGDILGRAAGVSSLQYDMVITTSGAQQLTQKIYVKKNKMRMEMTQSGQTIIVLIDMDAKTMYNYMPAQNMAIKMTFNPTSKSAMDEAKSLSNYNPTIVGTETIDGKVCTVVQYTAQGASTKMWLWQDHGLPIRVEAVTAQVTTLMEYKNIQFSDIADSTFELPAGVQIMQQPGT
jgi:hypothetical protein